MKWETYTPSEMDPNLAALSVLNTSKLNTIAIYLSYENFSTLTLSDMHFSYWH